MAKIAVASITREAAEVRENDPLARRVLAGGNGWSVADVICSAGPHHRAFEERHSAVCIAMVVEGTFQYRSSTGRELMIPGTLMLGNAGQYFTCGHDHAAGDRCISFAYEPEYLDQLVAEGGLTISSQFAVPRIPPLRELTSLISRAQGEMELTARADDGESWEEIAIELALRALQLAGRQGRKTGESLPAAEARVTRIVRRIESHPESPHELGVLAADARLSRYHFLRVFQQVTGTTPHRYVRRMRLSQAATRLLTEPGQILDIALDCGFGDVSNFNHAFVGEFGMAPSEFRKRTSRGAR